MAIPVDDGVSDFYWSPEGVLMERSTGLPRLDDDGNEIVWQEPEPDPNESIPYSGPTIWAVLTYRLPDPEAHYPETIWVQADTEVEALAIYYATAGQGRELLDVDLWQPDSQAHHLRWLNGHEGNLSQIISRT